jgi:hypothetical protein
MLNINTQLMDLVQQKVINTDEFFVLLCIAKRIGKKNQAFPSRSLLMKETCFGKTKLSEIITNLVKSGLLAREQKKPTIGKNKFSTNLYTIKTNLLSVFINLNDEMLEEETVTANEDTENEDTEKRSLSIKQSIGSIKQSIEVKKDIKKESLEEVRKNNISLMTDYVQTLIDNPQNTDKEWKGNNARLNDLVFDQNVAKNKLLDKLEYIVGWINKQTLNKLSTNPQPKDIKSRFYKFFDDQIPKCYGYPPKPNYNQTKSIFSSPQNQPQQDPNYVSKTGIISEEW